MSKTILVIEDEPAIRNDLVTILNLSDYNTLDAPNGRLGIELAQENLPDLIISDIMMPEVDGFAVLKELQKKTETSDIPFLFLSAKSAKLDIREGMSLGADDFITKPYDIDELLEAIKVRLKKSEKIEKKYNKKIEEFRSNVQRSMPHEIRTPLNIILGMTDFLKKNYKKMSEADILEMLDNVSDSGKRLNRLFENYLFYANLELISSSLDDIKYLRTKSTELCDIFIREIVNTKVNQQNRLEDLKFELEEGRVKVAENYLSKIIEEIIDNSLKFSEKGSTILVKTFKIKDNYHIWIKDKGRGMSPEQIKSIGAYVQFERKVYEQQGNGLGITIVQRIVELHNGKLEIESVPNEFTNIKIQLPVN